MGCGEESGNIDSEGEDGGGKGGGRAEELEESRIYEEVGCF